MKVPHERAAIVKENVGVVFLTNGQESPARMLRLLLTKWDLLNFLDDHEPRPFASFLSPNGSLTTRFLDFQSLAESSFKCVKDLIVNSSFCLPQAPGGLLYNVRGRGLQSRQEETAFHAVSPMVFGVRWRDEPCLSRSI